MKHQKRNPYQTVLMNRPGRSLFDLSYEKKLTCDMGELIPISCDEVVPGDVFDISCQAVCRFQPLVAPILHEVNMYVHYFHVPYRLLWNDWEEFITGGVDNESLAVLPRWEPSTIPIPAGQLWDYLGFPMGITPDGVLPMDFPRRAYNMIYNEYYRDENLIDEEPLDNEDIKNRCWQKDYFTSALLTQQRGESPALPLSGFANVQWPDWVFIDGFVGSHETVQVRTDAPDEPYLYVDTPNGRTNLRDHFNANILNTDHLATFDIADLRQAFQLQKWMERNQRAGVRYTEFLQSHFGVSPNDARLQRPEYIGGAKTPVIVSEVLQTSATGSTGTPQGNMAGHGMAIAVQHCGRIRIEEFGLIMGIMSIMPKPSYSSQGINRQWLRETKYDFYFPDFAHLSEQPILNAEVCLRGVDADDLDVFGFQGRYDEMRTKDDQVVAGMRSTFDYWHIARQFSTALVVPLNDEFVICRPRKDIFAVPSEDGLIVSFANIIKAFRPLPVQSMPGFIDH